MTTQRHITTRRGFIAAAGFGGVSLYGLWAAYGAAPGPLTLLGLDNAHAVDEGHAQAETASPEAAGGHADAGHGGHGAARGGPSLEEFSRLTAEFIERYRLPDGTVYVRPLATGTLLAQGARAGMEDAHGAKAGGDPHAGMDHATPQANVDHAVNKNEVPDGAAPSATDGSPIDVLMTAGKFYYLPNVLRLDAGQPYRFRMMALDVSHGASIQFGRGGRMARLRPGRLTEFELTFHQPGRLLVACTVYCGAGHDLMQASIEVVGA